MTKREIDPLTDAARWALCADAGGAGKGGCNDDCACLREAKVVMGAIGPAIERLRSLLECALLEHDNHEGKFAADYMPNHWTHQARKYLGTGSESAPGLGQCKTPSPARELSDGTALEQNVSGEVDG